MTQSFIGNYIIFFNKFATINITLAVRRQARKQPRLLIMTTKRAAEEITNYKVKVAV